MAIRTNVCRTTFNKYMAKVSLAGCFIVFLMVGSRAAASMIVAIIIEITGFLVRYQGIIAIRATTKSILSERLFPLTSFFRANREMVIAIRLTTPALQEPAPPPEDH